MFYADPAGRATGAAEASYFPILPSSCASSGSAW
jgi:hypothetical protein